MSPRRALVMFSGSADAWWLCLLRRGFRHCFLAIEDGPCWLILDPLSHRTELAAVAAEPGRDLAAAYRGAGLTVVETVTRTAPRRLAPIRPYSCVEAVKRTLGIHAGGVLTPWQLYKFLMDRKNCVDTFRR
ncbi:MAG: hypothetical protein ACM33T_01725 [Solirubrobacterales bacterium]